MRVVLGVAVCLFGQKLPPEIVVARGGVGEEIIEVT